MQREARRTESGRDLLAAPPSLGSPLLSPGAGLTQLSVPLSSPESSLLQELQQIK